MKLLDAAKLPQLFRNNYGSWAGHQSLAQVHERITNPDLWNHPGVLQLIKDRKVSAKHENVLEADDSSSEENMDYNVIPGGRRLACQRNHSIMAYSSGKTIMQYPEA
ncbi:hypothetical protein Leryth_025041 [Lithospermum erythrorhizon]|nr:hypothetical protein Leryth_025041 [Lithospermum erythrorhizon]